MILRKECFSIMTKHNPTSAAPSPEERVRTMTQKLKEGEYRLTPQRLAILEALAHSRTHPSAEQVHQQLLANFPTMSLATVYKTIAMLKREGEILELEFSELGNRYDINRPYPHPHVICTSCGMVMDPSDHDIGETTKRISSETGFTITSHRLDFYGLCPTCQGKR